MARDLYVHGSVVVQQGTNEAAAEEICTITSVSTSVLEANSAHNVHI
jgi:hypothetical protein